MYKLGIILFHIFKIVFHFGFGLALCVWCVCVLFLPQMGQVYYLHHHLLLEN